MTNVLFHYVVALPANKTGITMHFSLFVRPNENEAV